MRLMSFCATAMDAAKTAVTAPIHVTTWSTAVSAAAAVCMNAHQRINARYKEHTRRNHRRRVDERADRVSDLPSRRAGHTCSGTWPDFPTAPAKMSKPIAVDTAMPRLVVLATIPTRAVCSRQPLPPS